MTQRFWVSDSGPDTKAFRLSRETTDQGELVPQGGSSPTPLRRPKSLVRVSRSASGNGGVNMIRGVLKTFGLLPGAGRGLRFDHRVEALLDDAPDIALIVRPLLVSWRQLREQIAVFDKAVRRQVRIDPICRLLMTVPGIGALSSLMYAARLKTLVDFPDL